MVSAGEVAFGFFVFIVFVVIAIVVIYVYLEFRGKIDKKSSKAGNKSRKENKRNNKESGTKGGGGGKNNTNPQPPIIDDIRPGEIFSIQSVQNSDFYLVLDTTCNSNGPGMIAKNLIDAPVPGESQFYQCNTANWKLGNVPGTTNRGAIESVFQSGLYLGTSDRIECFGRTGLQVESGFSNIIWRYDPTSKTICTGNNICLSLRTSEPRTIGVDASALPSDFGPEWQWQPRAEITSKTDPACTGSI